MVGPGRADPAGTELERVVRRWQQLPLDRALPAVPGVAGCVQALADAVAEAEGMPSAPVPDLGPAVLMDQLRVMVYDWRAAGLDEEDLTGRLTALRRVLP
ncbi:hypothetical protein [Ornithinimicrobium pekingense]|uniref:Uncharacterized protein n=1 Tax=Ornithinimicrobium pekingense TaxID=384677 RepID=A0ABQ2FBY3_9MICO|nr:hypothetical protein [Ornithinimicrobium pekingense]GGK81115.1 hypothetical protein GCM10011509_31970 [Ornithinimicrobium pekingense]